MCNISYISYQSLIVKRTYSCNEFWQSYNAIFIFVNSLEQQLQLFLDCEYISTLQVFSQIVYSNHSLMSSINLMEGSFTIKSDFIVQFLFD